MSHAAVLRMCRLAASSVEDFQFTSALFMVLLSSLNMQGPKQSLGIPKSIDKNAHVSWQLEQLSDFKTAATDTVVVAITL